ncbi:MAG: GNAT family N-acetyltransferase [Saprospiraceae bacterium]|nr:GNAT family N-acetyltransferase [Saprospiraceae bacterium]
MEVNNAVLRLAVPEDAPKLLELVMELAVYEKAPEEVRTGPEEYRNGLQSGLFQAIVVELPNTGIVGMALFFPYFSTWGGKTLYLEDFIVREPFRRFGFGKLLFDAFLETAIAQSARKVKWQVLDWNEPAKSFYKKYGAKMIAGWENGVIQLDDQC